MILPSYSLRAILHLAIVVAVVALIAGQAVQGTNWAIAVTVAVASVVLSWLVFVLFYGIVASFSRVALSRETHAPQPAYYPEPRRNAPEPVEKATNPSAPMGD